MRDTSAAGRASSLEHDPADALRKPSRGQSQWLKRLAGSARPPLLLAGAAPLAGGVLLVIQAWLLASVLDAAIARQAPRSDLLGGILGIAALMLVRACIAWAGERAGAIAAERIKRQVRLALFERLVDKGPHWSRGQASGVLASAVVDQVEALDGFFAKYLPAMAAAAMLPVAFSVLLFPVDVIAGLVLLITAPLIPLFMALVGWARRARAGGICAPSRGCPDSSPTVCAGCPRSSCTDAPRPRPNRWRPPATHCVSAPCPCCASPSCPRRCWSSSPPWASPGWPCTSG